MTVKHRTVRDRVVFGGAIDAPALLVSPRLDGDAVVSGVDVTIGDVHVATGFGIDSISVG